MTQGQAAVAGGSGGGMYVPGASREQTAQQQQSRMVRNRATTPIVCLAKCC